MSRIGGWHRPARLDRPCIGPASVLREVHPIALVAAAEVVAAGHVVC
jgi:hypothetical protein